MAFSSKWAENKKEQTNYAEIKSLNSQQWGNDREDATSGFLRNNQFL